MGLADDMKKLVGKIHKPTMISALEDEIIESEALVKLYEQYIESQKNKIADNRRKIEELKK